MTQSETNKPAKSAREAIREAYDAFDAWANTEPMAMTLEEMANDEPPVMARSVRRIAVAALALRALLDAPTNATERLCEAAEELCKDADDVREDNRDAHRLPIHHAIINRLDVALAAVRASPEGVGVGDGPSDAVIWENRCERLSELVTSTERERDALKAELEKARANVETFRERNREWSDAVAERNVAVNAANEERDNARAAFDRERTRAERAEADLEKARGEVERVVARTKQAESDLDEARTFRWGVEWGREGYRKVMALFKDATDAKKFIEVTSGLRAQAVEMQSGSPWDAQEVAPERDAPPPASEAPISERARLIYEGAMHYIATTAAAGLQDGPEDCARIARRVLEECERAAKGEGAS